MSVSGFILIVFVVELPIAGLAACSAVIPTGTALGVVFWVIWYPVKL